MTKSTIPNKDKHSTEKLGYKAHDKKDGAGKGGWGKQVADDVAEKGYLDKNDPNYPEEDEEAPTES